MPRHTLYTCARCGYESVKKADFNRHNERKRPCVSAQTPASKLNHMEENNEHDIHLQQTIKALEERVMMLENHPSQVINNNTMNITINVFGKEDVSYLTEEQREGFLLGKQAGLLSLIKEIHFNPEHPENRTVVLKSSKRKLASVSVGAGRFEVIPLKNAIDTVISNNHKVATKKYMSDAAYREELDSKFKTFEGFGQIQDWNMKLNGCRFAQAEMKRNVYAVFDHERNEIKEGEVNL